MGNCMCWFQVQVASCIMHFLLQSVPAVQNEIACPRKKSTYIMPVVQYAEAQCKGPDSGSLPT